MNSGIEMDSNSLSSVISDRIFERPSSTGGWNRLKQFRVVGITIFVLLILIVGSVSVAMVIPSNGRKEVLEVTGESGFDGKVHSVIKSKTDEYHYTTPLEVPGRNLSIPFLRFIRSEVPRLSGRNQATLDSSSSNSNTPSTDNSTDRQNQSGPDETPNNRNPISVLNEKEHRYHPRYDFEHCTLHRKKVSVQSFWSKVYIPRTNQTFGPAYGRNKKEAKKRVAEIALTSMYNMTSLVETDHLIPRHQIACSESSQNESET